MNYIIFKNVVFDGFELCEKVFLKKLVSNSRDNKECLL